MDKREIKVNQEKTDKREILKNHVSGFVSLTAEEIDYFVSHFKEHSFKKGQAVISLHSGGSYPL